MKIKIPFFELEITEKEMITLTGLHKSQTDSTDLADYYSEIPILIMGKLTKTLNTWLCRNICGISGISFVVSLLLKIFITNLLPNESMWISGVIDALIVLSMVLFVAGGLAYILYAILKIIDIVANKIKVFGFCLIEFFNKISKKHYTNKPLK